MFKVVLTFSFSLFRVLGGLLGNSAVVEVSVRRFILEVLRVENMPKQRFNGRSESLMGVRKEKLCEKSKTARPDCTPYHDQQKDKVHDGHVYIPEWLGLTLYVNNSICTRPFRWSLLCISLKYISTTCHENTKAPILLGTGYNPSPDANFRLFGPDKATIISPLLVLGFIGDTSKTVFRGEARSGWRMSILPTLSQTLNVPSGSSDCRYSF